jgi:hypothetical protein
LSLVGSAGARVARVVIADEPGVLRLAALVRGALEYAEPATYGDLAAAAGDAPRFRCGNRFVVAEEAADAPRGRRFLVYPRPAPERLLERDPAELAASLYALRFQDVLDYAAAIRGALLAGRDAVLESTALVGGGAFVDPRMMAVVFEALPHLFDPAALAEAVDRELGMDGRPGRDFLDGWVESPAEAARGMTARMADLVLGRLDGGAPRRPCVRAVPTRQLHVTAGNSPLLPLLSLLRGLATKGACVVKSPAEASLACAVVAGAMRAAAPDHPVTRHTSLLYWPGGDPEYESCLLAADTFDRVVVWGSAETVASVRQRTPLTKTVALNPRYGISLVRPGTRSPEAAARASIDSLVWEQQACTASLVHYVEGSDEEALAYSRALAQVLARWDRQRGRPLPRVLQGRIRLLRRGEWVHGAWFENTVAGELSSAVVYMRGPVDLARHPMARLVAVRRVERLSDVPPTLTPSVSTAGVFPEDALPGLRDALAAAGVSNILPLGETERTHPGMPHDGMRVLSELVSWTTSAGIGERSLG